MHQETLINVGITPTDTCRWQAINNPSELNITTPDGREMRVIQQKNSVQVFVKNNEQKEQQALEICMTSKNSKLNNLLFDRTEPSKAYLKVDTGIEIHMDNTQEGLIMDLWDFRDENNPECVDTWAIHDND